jgi:hypothetical protein
MSSLVPLNSAIAQSSVDFNNQTPTDAVGLFRYKINNYTGDRTLNGDDINSVCIFSGDTILSLTTGFTNLKVNSEIIFYSVNGYVRVQPGVGVNLYSTNGYYTKGPSISGGLSSVGKLICIGTNTWCLAGYNEDYSSYSWTDCCGYLPEVWQVAATNTFHLDARVYADSGLTTPFNGVVDAGSGLSYNVINGWPGATASCTAYAYSTSYTFYTGGGTADAVTFYSVAGLTPSDYSSLLGKKFFTAAQGTQFPCYDTSEVSDGTATSYYGSTAQYPASPANFKDGYVINVN